MREPLRGSNQRKVGLIVLAALVLVVGLPRSLSAADAQERHKLFQEKCVQCHGEDGSGSTVVGKSLGAADLRSPAVQKLTDPQLYLQIDEGKGNMPGFGAGLDKAQINELIAYVRDLGKTQKPKTKSH
jgi:mono/diheme cytochrome c family protein